MNYKPNPLLYGAKKDFYSTFKLVATMVSAVDYEMLSCSVKEAMERYPYFSVCPEKEGESIVLKFNERPVPVFADGRCVTLGSEESNGHLLIFGCEDDKIILNASHYIADGMGIVPLLLTVICLYIAKVYGEEGIGNGSVSLPGEPVMKEEYEYPFPDKPFEIDQRLIPEKKTTEAYELEKEAFDDCGLYAYHIRIPEKDMMARANPSDGSPVSFISVMLYRALFSLDKNIEKSIVVHVQHQYRHALNTPLSRHNLVCYIPVVLPPKMKDRDIDFQNTAIRGQVIIGSEKEADLNAVNRLITAFENEENMSLDEKKQAMGELVDLSIFGKTFGISYMGKINWCKMERYVKDFFAYIGEKNKKNMLLIEVMSIGDDFSVTFMQGGRGRRYIDAFVKELERLDIPVSITGEEGYTLCDTKIPGSDIL